tara:strand:- start:1093 stop:1569 length:477 start_codon:yes stop_codon:yes gene_type:complete
MIVILNSIEANLAQAVGQGRHNQNQKNGTSSSAQSKLANDVNGFGAELAVAKSLNCWPDLSIGPHRRGFDLTYIYKGKKIRIDVKSTKMNPGYLMAKKWRKLEDCDVYVHVSGTSPRYVIHGWAWSKELISPVNLSDMGFGEHYHMEPSQLREFNLNA